MNIYFCVFCSGMDVKAYLRSIIAIVVQHLDSLNISKGNKQNMQVTLWWAGETILGKC